ncbi:hypothetical protein LR48_Vigan08g055100 [Vigna angularis]|uniref:Uncharacterized protein n=1 Tax=Phaseolus angularis TaxID=3914 RepID=A0A0L9V4R4_PHAAN|nr:hypothetical protein LR48_Vigan08g055100 [Vigna angularis]
MVPRMEKMKIVAALRCGSGKNLRLSVDGGDGDAIAERGRKRSWPAVRVASRREELAEKKGCAISKETNGTPTMVVVVAAVDDAGGDGSREEDERWLRMMMRDGGGAATRLMVAARVLLD